jgi:hypothetical protein
MLKDIAEVTHSLNVRLLYWLADQFLQQVVEKKQGPLQLLKRWEETTRLHMCNVWVFGSSFS